MRHILVAGEIVSFGDVFNDFLRVRDVGHITKREYYRVSAKGVSTTGIEFDGDTIAFECPATFLAGDGVK